MRNKQKPSFIPYLCLMIKFIITGAIIYFIVRSFANKPWKQEIHIHQDKAPTNKRSESREDYTDYEEID